MKIAIFSLAYFPFVGGAEIAIKEITDRIPDGNFTCFTHRFDRQWLPFEKIGNLDVVRIGKGGLRQHDYYGQFFKKLLYAFKAWRAAEKHHKQKPFDVIWAMMASYAGIAALLFKLRHPKVPMLLTLQEGDSEEHILRRVGIFYPFWRMLFKKADHIQVISNYLADFAKRHGADCPITVVPNGVNLKRFIGTHLTSNKTKAASACTLHPRNSKPHVIITTSRLVQKNGLDILIRAAFELGKIGCTEEYKIQILGSGPEEKKLKSLAKELGVERKVEFLGHIDPEDIPNYLARADVFVRVPRSEGLGNSFLEAMAAGLPVIATPVGGILDFLHPHPLHSENVSRNDHSEKRSRNNAGANGLFAKVNDPKDLAYKINILLKDSDLRKQLGENGRELVVRRYDWEKIATEMKAIFNLLHPLSENGSRNYNNL